MARYIDADALYKETEKKIKANNERGMAVVDGEFLDLINDAFTEDVVPKSEVKRLEAEIERLKKYNTDVAFKHYNDGKADATSEIFAEIGDIFLMFKPQYFVDAPHLNYKRLTDLFAELKKKYTENISSPAPEEKYFSPQDVRKMTPKEVHDNYSAIIKSMELWQ